MHFILIGSQSLVHSGHNQRKISESLTMAPPAQFPVELYSATASLPYIKVLTQVKLSFPFCCCLSVLHQPDPHLYPVYTLSVACLLSFCGWLTLDFQTFYE